MTGGGRVLGVATPHHGEARERVLNAAHQLFVAQGFAEVSMQQIAASAGITKATMYHHYPSKEALFLAVCLREGEQMRAGLERSVRDEQPFRAQLEAVIRFLLDSASNADTGRLIADLHRHVDRQHRAAVHDLANPATVIRPLFEQAIARREIRPIDLDTVVPMLLGMVFGQVRFAMSEGRPDHLRKDLAPTITTVLIDGIGTTGHYDCQPCILEET